jgi:hypothetical protein
LADYGTPAEPVTTNTSHGAVRVLGLPWRIGTTDDGLAVPMYKPFVGEGTVSEETFIDGLNDAQIRTVLAAHEAGHAVYFFQLGMPISEVSVYPENPHSPSSGVASGMGHTRFSEPKPSLPVPEIVAASLAGQLASEMWLEKAGLLTPARRFLTQRVCAGDHDEILAIRTQVPVAYLYGEVNPPAGWDGAVVQVDPLIESTRFRLEASWASVKVLTEHLDRHGNAHADTLRALIDPLLGQTLSSENSQIAP